MTKTKSGMKISTKLNVVFILCLFAITGAQTWLRNNTNQQTAVILSIVLTLAAFGVMWLYVHRVVAGSLKQLLEAARLWSTGDLSAQVNLQTRDEFQQLGETCNQLAADLNQSLKGLEITIAERTLILHRRAKQIQAAAEVGRAAVTIRDLDLLLPEVTRLISTRFDVYHVGIFLLDPSGEYAVLRATNSEGGRQLLQEEHKIKVGMQGIVGYVARMIEPRISLDVGTDAVYFKNTHLPETRSEMALPLSVGGKILGVLDVQSSRAAAFTDEDASILQIMADQIAIAIDNAHLLAESEEALDNSRRAYGELSHEIWNKILRSRVDTSFIATKEKGLVRSTERAWDPELSIACQSGEVIRSEINTVIIPIKLRDQVIGVVRLRKSESERDWSQEEIKLLQTISDQISIALESARLYEDTQRTAERERIAGEITAKMRASNDPQEILQVAASELRKALQTSRAQVLIKTSKPVPPSPKPDGNGRNGRGAS